MYDLTVRRIEHQTSRADSDVLTSQTDRLFSLEIIERKFQQIEGRRQSDLALLCQQQPGVFVICRSAPAVNRTRHVEMCLHPCTSRLTFRCKVNCSKTSDISISFTIKPMIFKFSSTTAHDLDCECFRSQFFAYMISIFFRLRGELAER